MTRDEQLKSCNICRNRAFSNEEGTICRLTNKVADFEGRCPNFDIDVREAEIVEENRQALKNSEPKLMRRARIALFVVGAINILFGIFLTFSSGQYLDGIITIIFGLFFIGTGIWSFWQPFIAFIIGLSFYLLINILMIYVDPMTLFRGLVMKILIVSSLIYGIKGAKDAQDELNKAKEDLIDQL